MDLKKVLQPAIAGFMTALLVDVSAWLKSGEPFDLSIAARRWILGAVTGLSTGLGFGAAGQ